MATQNNAINLASLIDQAVTVNLAGGRELEGKLKGYDQLLNLVLDEAEERLRDPQDMSKMSSEVRKMGLIVCRGPSVMVVCPSAGTESIENPFA